MQAAARHRAAGQRDVDGLGGQARVHQRVGQRLAARLQRGFHLLLDLVDARALALAGLRVELAEALEQFGQRAGLAEEAGLLVFQRGVVIGGGESGLGVGDDLVQILRHGGGRGVFWRRRNPVMRQGRPDVGWHFVRYAFPDAVWSTIAKRHPEPQRKTGLGEEPRFSRPCGQRSTLRSVLARQRLRAAGAGIRQRWLSPG